MVEFVDETVSTGDIMFVSGIIETDGISIVGVDREEVGMIVFVSGVTVVEGKTSVGIEGDEVGEMKFVVGNKAPIPNTVLIPIPKTITKKINFNFKLINYNKLSNSNNHVGIFLNYPCSSKRTITNN